MKTTVNTIFKAVALAMGVATVVITSIGEVGISEVSCLLGIGLACLAIASLNSESSQK